MRCSVILHVCSRGKGEGCRAWEGQSHQGSEQEVTQGEVCRPGILEGASMVEDAVGGHEREGYSRLQKMVQASRIIMYK